MSDSRIQHMYGPGPFTADQIKPGAPYELSDGHPIFMAPPGGRGGGAALYGGTVLATDPAVTEAGVEVGYTAGPGELRAPDVAVGNVPDAPGWVKGVPPLAVEYADTGQDEPELRLKISELLRGGTKFLWVVRLTGPRRVEVYEPGREMRLVAAGGQLEAPGVLRNAVAVEALYDKRVALRASLDNLVQREGYASFEGAMAASEAKGLEAGREEGREQGLEEGREQGLEEGRLAAMRSAIADVLAARRLPLGTPDSATLDTITDYGRLMRMLRVALVADAAGPVLSTP